MKVERFNRMLPIRRVIVANRFAGKMVDITTCPTGRGKKFVAHFNGIMVGGAATNSGQTADVVIIKTGPDNDYLLALTGASVQTIEESE